MQRTAPDHPARAASLPSIRQRPRPAPRDAPLTSVSYSVNLIRASGPAAACRRHDSRRDRRSIQWIQSTAQLERPHEIPTCLTDRVTSAAGGDDNVLFTVDLIRGGRCIRAEAGLKAPELFAGLRVECTEEAVGPSVEKQAAAGRQNPAAEAGEIRHFL